MYNGSHDTSAEAYAYRTADLVTLGFAVGGFVRKACVG
jgi:hypothetical protein